MLQVGLEPTIPVFEWEKTVHASNRAATVTGQLVNKRINNISTVHVVFLVVMLEKADHSGRAV
jgi:hypothetical protein